MRTEAELCREALDVQSAVNLSGVVHAFSRALTELREILSKEPNFSTSRLNQHPVSILYSSKIASLTGSEVDHEFSAAYGYCCNQAEKCK